MTLLAKLQIFHISGKHLDEEAKMTIYERAVVMYFQERFYEEESEEEE